MAHSSVFRLFSPNRRNLPPLLWFNLGQARRQLAKAGFDLSDAIALGVRLKAEHAAAAGLDRVQTK